MAVTVSFTLFPAPFRWAAVGRRAEATWARLVRLAEKPQLWPSEPTIRASEDRLSGLILATLRDNSRVLASGGKVALEETRDRVERVSGLVVEYVDDPLADEQHLRRWWSGRQVLAYTTAFHQHPLGERPPGPRWRVLVPFVRSLSPEEARIVTTWVRHPRNDVGSPSELSEEPCRVAALPAIAPGGYHWFAAEGAALSLEQARDDLMRWEAEERAHHARQATADTTLADAVRHFRRRLAEPGRHTLLPWPGGARSLPDELGEVVVPAPDLSGLASLAGSLWPGRLAVLVGPAGSGRTSLALQLAASVASIGMPVLYANAALPSDELVARLLAQGLSDPARLPRSHAHLLEGGGDAHAVQRALDDLIEAYPRLFLWTPTTGERTDEALRARAVGASEASEGGAPLIIVDPVEGFEDGGRLEHTLAELSAACRDLVRAGSLDPLWPGAAVLVVMNEPTSSYATAADLFELAGDPARRAALRQSLSTGCGGLGSDAALLLALARDASPPDGPAESAIAVVKNRHGHTGCVRLDFHGAAGVHVDRGLVEHEATVPPS